MSDDGVVEHVSAIGERHSDYIYHLMAAHSRRQFLYLTSIIESLESFCYTSKPTTARLYLSTVPAKQPSTSQTKFSPCTGQHFDSCHLTCCHNVQNIGDLCDSTVDRGNLVVDYPSRCFSDSWKILSLYLFWGGTSVTCNL